jgi:hypothetical protein
MSTVIKIYTSILKIERKSRLVRAWKKDIRDISSEVLSESEDLGWAVLLEGSAEWLFIGQQEPPPNFTVGKKVAVTLAVLD